MRWRVPIGQKARQTPIQIRKRRMKIKHAIERVLEQEHFQKIQKIMNIKSQPKLTNYISLEPSQLAHHEYAIILT